MRYECECRSKKLRQTKGEYQWEVEAVKTPSHEAAAKIREIPKLHRLFTRLHSIWREMKRIEREKRGSEAAIGKATRGSSCSGVRIHSQHLLLTWLTRL